MKSKRVAFVVPDLGAANRPERDVSKAWVHAVRRSGAELVVLPECFDDYWFEWYHNDLDSARRLAATLVESFGRPVVVGLTMVSPEPAHPGCALFALASDGEQSQVRFKLSQTEWSPLTSEDDALARREIRATATPIRIAGHRIGVTVCYDHRLALQAARFMDAGMDAYVCISGNDYSVSRWSTVLRARAIEHDVPAFSITHRDPSQHGVRTPNRAQFIAIGPGGFDLLVDEWGPSGHRRRIPWNETGPSNEVVYTVDLDALEYAPAGWPANERFTKGGQGEFSIGLQGSGAEFELCGTGTSLRLRPGRKLRGSENVARARMDGREVLIGYLDEDAIFDADAVHELVRTLTWELWPGEDDDSGVALVVNRWRPEQLESQWQRVYAVAAARPLEFRVPFVVAGDERGRAALFLSGPGTPSLGRRLIEPPAGARAVRIGANATRGYAHMITPKGLSIPFFDASPDEVFERYCFLERGARAEET